MSLDSGMMGRESPTNVCEDCLGLSRRRWGMECRKFQAWMQAEYGLTGIRGGFLRAPEQSVSIRPELR